MVGREEMASSCAWGGSGRILGKISSLTVLRSIGTGCPGLSRHPWRYLKDRETWRLGPWFGGGLGSWV